MLGLNPFQLAMMVVLSVLVLATAHSIAGTQLIISGRRRLFIYGIVLLVGAAVFFNIVESRTGMAWAR